MAQLDARTIFVAWSATPKVYSRDVDYEYRQDSNLLYLTAVDQEDTILVLMPGNLTRKEVLFIRDPDPRREHWEGHALTEQEARALTGIEAVYFVSQFEAFIASMFNREPFGEPRGVPESEYQAFFDAVEKGEAKLALIFGPKPEPSAPLTRAHEFAARARERYVGLSVVDATHAVHGLRQVKTPYEQKILTRSLEISSEAHKAGMRAASPGKYEYEVEAAIEHVYLANGAPSPGYPSIVGSGPNATILHYSKSTRQMQAGDLLLVDAAANYQGLTGDITRTYPVSGTFTDAQKDIYRLVVTAQEAGMKAARVGGRTRDIESAAEEVVRKGLVALGLVTDATGDQFRLWYTHGICHWIGIDVHDEGDYRRDLEPGMSFVIEPGLYIRPRALDALPDTPENRAFKEKVRPAVEKYRDIGVRVEDSFLLTDQGLKRLSDVPRTVDEIERFLGDRGSGTGDRDRPTERPRD